MIKFPNLGYEISPNAHKLLEERYLFRDGETGKIIEKPFDMFNRVANKVSEVEETDSKRKKYYEEFYNLMAMGFFMPNTPTLLNAGRGNNSVMSGCFVIDLVDRTTDGDDSIFGAIELMAKIHKWGGGTGCNFTPLRPKNSQVSSTGHKASGPVSFMGNFDEAVESIQQGGMRRGANMSILMVHHPDIELFIQCKNELNYKSQIIHNRIVNGMGLEPNGEFSEIIKTMLALSQLNNMNISIGIDKEFKEALFNGDDYNLYDPRNGKICGKKNAAKIFEMIVENAWKSGEPGIIDFERINQDNMTPALGALKATNPCAEQPLYPWECCNLGSISLPKMMDKKNGEWIFNYQRFRNTIRIAVRFLDNVIDAQKYPTPKIESRTKRCRKIGLGIMGFADACIRLGIPYGSESCLNFINELGSFWKKDAYTASSALAIEKGSFPAIKKSLYNGPMRNANRLTIAPTGSISGIAGVSFGIEPYYAYSLRRRILDGKEFIEISPIVREKLIELGMEKELPEIEKYLSEKSVFSSSESLGLIPVSVANLFVSAYQLTPAQHIKVQGAFQKYVDNGVSKTINMLKDTTKEEVAESFKLALKNGCKGVTIYRDESRDEQVLSYMSKSKLKSVRHVKSRNMVLSGRTYEKKIGECGKIYVTINEDGGRPFEIFITAGKSGGCLESQVQAIGRIISIAWRGGLGTEEVIKQLMGITCYQGKPSLNKNESFLSCADAVARIIQTHVTGAGGKVIVDDSNPASLTCSICGGPLVKEGRCITCLSCFNSKCG